MEVKDYISTVLSHINNKVYLASIEQELKDHIADRAGYYKDIGYDAEASLQKAMERIGNPDEVGEQMNRLHSSKRSKTAVIIMKVVHILALSIFLVFGDDILYVPFSAMFYGLMADLTAAFLFFIVLICCCVEFVLAAKTRDYKLMKSTAYINIVSPYLIFTPPSPIREASLDFSVFKGMSFSEILTASSTQLLYIYILFVLAVLLLTGVVSYMLAAEFKAFEKGKAQMSVIYKAEKYKYFLYAMCAPFVVYVVLLIGNGYGYFC